MSKIIILIFICNAYILMLYADENHSKYLHSAPLYINMITKSASKQLSLSEKCDILNKTVLILPIVASYDYKTTTILTQYIDENLLYSMNVAGFQVIDPQSAQHLKEKTDYILRGSFTRYKHDIVINLRIIDRQKGIILCVGQVHIPKRVEKEIQRITHKDGWFKK